MRQFIIFLFFLINLNLWSQTHTDSLNLTAPIIFGKLLRPLILNETSITRYGKFIGTASRSTFADIRASNFKKMEFKDCGWNYKKFEKYCVTENIYYNKAVLQKFRKEEYWCIFLNLITVPEAIYYTYDLYNNSLPNFPNKYPNVYFKSAYAKVFVPLIFIELIVSAAILAKSERKFRSKIFKL